MKWVLRILGGLVLLVVVSVVAVALLVDPNRLKPEIEKQLAAQQLYLKLNGDIGWQLFPNFGIEMADATLFDSPDSNKDGVLTQVDVLSFSVQVLPLLTGSIAVDGVNLSGVNVNMTTYEDGSTNWDSLGAAAEAPVPEEPPSEGSPSSAPALDIHSVTISDIEISLVDELLDSTTVLNVDSILIEDVNLAGDAMRLSAKLRYAATDLPTVEVTAASLLTFDIEASLAQLETLDIDVTTNNGASLTMAASATVALAPLKADATLAVTTTTVQKWLDALAVELPPETLQPDALQSFSFHTAVSAAENTETGVLNTSLNNAKLRVDSTEFNGDVSIDIDPKKPLPALNTQWHSSLVDLNAFLLPPPEETAVAEEAETPVSELVLAPTELPLQLLRDLTMSASISIDQVLYQSLPIDSVLLDTVASNGVIRLNSASAKIQEGQFAAEATADARGDLLTVDATAVSDSIDLGFVAQNLAEVNQVGGYLNADVVAKTHGLTDVALTDNLVASVQADSPELRIIPVNLIKTVCQAGALLEKKDMPEYEWKEYTDLTPLSLKAELNKGVATISQMTASIEQFNASATGSYNTLSGDFEVPIELKLAQAAAAIPECNYVGERLRDISIPLLCKGNAETLGIDTCLPNKDIIKRLAKQRLNKEVDKQKDKLKEKADDIISDKLGEEAGSLLKGLFR